MTTRPDDEHLNDDELWARDRLEALLGSLRVTDKKGGSPGLHDFEADLPGGLVAAIEVTSEVERERLDLAASAQRHLSGLELHSSDHCWQVGLASDATINAIDAVELLALLSDLESQGRWRALNRGDSSDPFVDRLEALGVESVYGFRAKPERRGLVVVGPGFYFGREWGGAAIDRWLDGFLASETGARKLKKLRRAAHAAERHLVIVIRSISQAGMGIPLGLTDRDEPGATPYVMPSFVPPEPLTDMWLLPMMATSEGLRWRRHSGWAVIDIWAAQI